MYSCQEYQPKIIAYLHEELAPPIRQKVAIHIDQCAACYAYYVRQRDLARELEMRMSLIGQAKPAQLRRVWSSIQDDMEQPRIRGRFRLRYGVAAFIFMLALILPWKTQSRVEARYLPLQPVPVVEDATKTPALHLAKSAATLMTYSAEDNLLTPTRAPVPNSLVTP